MVIVGIDGSGKGFHFGSEEQAIVGLKVGRYIVVADIEAVVATVVVDVDVVAGAMRKSRPQVRRRKERRRRPEFQSLLDRRDNGEEVDESHLYRLGLFGRRLLGEELT